MAMKSLKHYAKQNLTLLIAQAIQPLVEQQQGIIDALARAEAAIKTLKTSAPAPSPMAADTKTVVAQLSQAANEQIVQLQQKVDTLTRLVQVNYDRIEESTILVDAMRHKAAYTAAFANDEPLVTIRIATYNRSQTLIDKAIRSILQQTYQNFEVVIVGDHCTDDTAEKIKALNDSRFSFYNLPLRTVYPEDRIDKWQVIGAPAMNAAAAMANGVWIAPIDDDDEFTPDHLEVLVKVALINKCEFVYGAMDQHNLVTGETTKIWSSPPAYGKISVNGSMYLSLLDTIFKYDTHSYLLDRAADWTMVRRMMESGVRMANKNTVIGRLNMIPAGDDAKDY